MSAANEEQVVTTIDRDHFVENSNEFDGHKNDFTTGINFDIEVGGERRTTIESIEMLALAATGGTTSTTTRKLLVPLNRNKHHETQPSNMGGLNPECFDFDEDAASS